MFYQNRNKSNTYAKKLYDKFKSELKILAQKPDIGVKTRIDNIRGLIVDDYIIYNEIFDDRIMILKVWDSRQDPDKL